MAQWIPPDKVGSSESVGRRLFEVPPLSGTEGQPPFSGLQLYHFEEKRTETSLDRLGRSNVEKQVVHYLKPRAVAHAESFQNAKRFLGWAVAPAKDVALRKGKSSSEVIASKVEGPDLSENIYHAHITCPENTLPYLFALHLKHAFEKAKNFEFVDKPKEESGIRRSPLLEAIVQIVGSIRSLWG